MTRTESLIVKGLALGGMTENSAVLGHVSGANAYFLVGLSVVDRVVLLRTLFSGPSHDAATQVVSLRRMCCLRASKINCGLFEKMYVTSALTNQQRILDSSWSVVARYGGYGKLLG